ncbi:calpain-8-like isoform X1 [Pelobates cultripes]|uniref:Calpain-8-like isoform X1 n=1 Tax=Pelobates cultripes TaxID=61616 RepID=A0AAD1VW47_PELCU|nr:calpain-8-like isoform X1 [Pelobates cultripes]
MSGIAVRISRDRAVAQGLGTPNNPVKYLEQDFEELRAQCLASGRLFEDPAFPPSSSSLGLKDWGPGSEKAKGIVWKRPAQIKSDASFMIDGATCEDVRQGSLGDCWFLCSIASLTQNKTFLSIVVPENQSMNIDYAGIFHFRFWQYGEWVDVVVDDQLPTKSGKLVFVKSLAGNEFWSALLEKAYAKLNGSYEALSGGLPAEALEDFTGGTAELYYLQNTSENLFQILQKRLKANALLTCTSKTDEINKESETVANNNVVKKHAYSITGAEEVPYCGSKVKLIRVRNPWGYKEWNGAWSDNAPEWNIVHPSIKDALNIKSEDGEFWMPFADLLKEYTRVEVCNINLSNALCSEDQKWCLTQFTGSWKTGFSAGGGKQNKETFWTNPQFWIVLDDHDNDYSGSITDPCCTIIVSLMQKDRRRYKPLGAKLYSIGFYIYKIPAELQKSNQIQLGKDFFRQYKDVAREISYKDHREISCRFKLPVGVYVIVPHTYDPYQEADICLRVFTEKKTGAFGDICVGINPVINELGVPNEAADVNTEASIEELNTEKNELNGEELKTALDEMLSKRADIKSDGFSLATCREIINLFDIDRSGAIGTKEFNVLLRKLEKYMEIFKEMDTNHSGTMDAYEMRNALERAGFNLNYDIQEVIVHRYISNGLSINFDDFIACMIRLETLFKMFDLLESNKSGSISLSLTEWLCAALA